MAQSIAGGTLEGTVTDPTVAALPKAEVSIINYLTNFRATATTDAKGTFRLLNLPLNTYHLEVKSNGFATFTRDIDVRNSIPQRIDTRLELPRQSTSLEVHAFGDEVLENVPYAHTDADAQSLRHLPPWHSGLSPHRCHSLYRTGSGCR